MDLVLGGVVLPGDGHHVDDRVRSDGMVVFRFLVVGGAGWYGGRGDQGEAEQ